MLQRTVYHNQETGDDSFTCPGTPVFVENVYLSTKIELGLEVHYITVSYRPFNYA